MRDIIFENGEYYHIFNRGVDKRETFIDDKDFWKFFDCLRDFNNSTYYLDRLGALGISKNSMRELHSDDFKRLGSFLRGQGRVVDIVSYNLIANHFHILAKQLQDSGISNLMHKVSLSYTNYFNKKHKRSGALFQGTYKAVHIGSEQYLLRLIGYINGNIEIHNPSIKAIEYSWSSYQAIRNALSSFRLSQDSAELSNLSVLSGLDTILSQFANIEQLDEFIKMITKESRENKKISKEMEKYFLDTDI